MCHLWQARIHDTRVNKVIRLDWVKYCLLQACNGYLLKFRNRVHMLNSSSLCYYRCGICVVLKGWQISVSFEVLMVEFLTLSSSKPGHFLL